MAKDSFRVKKGVLHLTPVTSLPSSPELGDIVLLESTSVVYRYDGTQWQQFIDEDTAQTLDNKTITNSPYISTDELLASVYTGSVTEDSSTTGSLVTVPTVNDFVLRLTNAGLVSVSGIAAPSPAVGQFFILTNDNATDYFEVLNDDTNAATANRIITGTNRKIKLQPGASLWFYYDIDATKWRVVGGTGSGGEGSVIKARLYNAIATALPTGTVVVDGVTVNAEDRVLFSNLTVDDNRVYEAVGVGTNITSWQALELFNQELDPVEGDLVVIQEGDSFAGRVGTFKSSEWTFNDNVRYFNGVDYWEQSSISTVALADNQASPADIFSVAALGSENMVIEYSILRNGNKDTGSIVISHNNSTLSYATYGPAIGDTGVELSADLDSGNVRFRYTSTSTGNTPTIKYMVRRWSDSAGGPASIPSYSITGTSIGGSGVAGQVALWDTATDLEGSTDLTFDSTQGVLNLGSGSTKIEMSKLASSTLTDNTSGQVVFQVPHASYKHFVIRFSIERDTNTAAGYLFITTNGTTASVADAFAEVGSVGVSFTADVSGANVRLLATTTNTGNNANLKYAFERWL